MAESCALTDRQGVSLRGEIWRKTRDHPPRPTAHSVRRAPDANFQRRPDYRSSGCGYCRSSWIGGFAFKRSVIEGQNIDEQQAYELIDIICSLIEAKTA